MPGTAPFAEFTLSAANGLRVTRTLVQPIRLRGDPGVEIVDVQRGALAFD
jgi:hypothetical protein